MIEAIEYATPTQIAERKHFLEIRQRIAQRAVKDIGIDLRRKPEAPKRETPTQPIPVEIPFQIDWVDRQYKWPSNFIDHVQRVVADEFDISKIDLESDRRLDEYVLPRHIAIYLCKTLTLKSLPEIGRKFHRDHTTILHAIRKITKQIRVNSFICQTVHDLATQLQVELDWWRLRSR